MVDKRKYTHESGRQHLRILLQNASMAAMILHSIDPWRAAMATSEDLRKRIEDFLDRHHVVSLATVGSQGAHAANLFYARDGLTLIWMSDMDSRHSREIETDAKVAATVSAASIDFRTIQGLQIHGTAQRTSRADRARLLSLLEAKFPFLIELRDSPKALQQAQERAEIYRLQPTDIVLIDNTRGFGHKETLTL